MQHPAVREVAVVVDNSKFHIQNSRLSEQLIAYVVADDSARNPAKDLRAFVAGKLPHYMVPAEFIMLDHLPLSPNGKVDYFNLPAPSRARAADIPYEGPRTPVERQLAEIFSAVLGIAQIGRRDDFFQLGGHSLLAAQASARIRQRFNIGLELRSFLEAPSVEALARRLESLGSSMAAEDREEIEL